MHGDGLRVLQQLPQPGLLLLPAGIGNPGAGQGIENMRLDMMHQPAGFTPSGNEVIPTPADVAWRFQTQQPVGKRVALVMVEQEPAVQAGPLDFALDGFKVHVLPFFARWPSGVWASEARLRLNPVLPFP